MTAPEPTYFESLGGEPILRPIIDTFVEATFADPMIGYFFSRANKARVKRFEYEHAAALLGAGTPYRGRDIGAAHASHDIRGGHFDRRRAILRGVLETFEVQPDIVAHWLGEVDALRGTVVRGACNA